MGRMTITIDDRLLEEAKALLGSTSKRETVHAALREVVRRKRREAALQHKGQVEIDLDQEGLQDYRSQK